MDQVVGLTLVTAEAEEIEVNAHSHVDLFHVLKGACTSSYGIVSALKLRVVKAPSRTTFISNHLTVADTIANAMMVMEWF